MNTNDRNDREDFDQSHDAAPESLAAVSALGPLSGDDAAELEAYLVSSEEARAEAASFAATASLLRTGAEPPASLKASIMSKIGSLPQLPAEAEAEDESATGTPPAQPATRSSSVDPVTAAPAAQATPAATGEPSAPTSKASNAAQSARTSKAQQKAKRRWYSGPVSGLVAAAALVVVLLGVNVVTSALNNGNGITEALRLAHISAQSDAMRETIRLTNINDEKQVTATLIWSGALAESVLIVDGLATLPEEKAYELWYIGEDGPISAGVFNTMNSGESWRVLDGAMSAGDAVGVTVEPAGGSGVPTTDPLIVIHTA